MNRKILVDCRLNDSCFDSLSKLGFNVVRLPMFESLDKPVSAHPDMLIYRLGNGLLTFSEYYTENKLLFDSLETEIFVTDEPVDRNYPSDIKLNALNICGTVYGKVNSISEIICANADKLVNVKQGYTRCSCCVVSDSAVITADIGVAAAMRRNGIDVLEINCGGIRLDGYDSGFIGGCSGKPDDKTLIFSGRISQHVDWLRISSFADKYGVKIIELSDKPLYDYGGFIVL